ncbi:MAG: methylcobamide--CoM methyltransferase [candidate division Zixibacteria bacterium]|nr:methylcobamide--CoM methyltransferase [candidate division Zixibacteria bacterium]
MIKTTVVGNYPKISSDRSVPNLRNALNNFDQKKISAEELERVYQTTIQRVVREQEEAGVDLPTDGQIRWDDIATFFARNFEGAQINGLIRFFDNNVYYRKPVFTGELKLKAPVSGMEYRTASIHSRRRLKGVVVGPYTLARMSVDEYYRDEERLVMTLASILRQEVLDLQAAGAEYIQIDEPFLTWAPEGLSLANRALTEMLANVRAKKIFCLYFGSIKPLVPHLYDFPVDIFAVDTVSKPENLKLLLETPLNKGVVAGCLDARNIKLEPKSELSFIYEQLASQNRSEVFVSPSSGLEFLPHSDAVAKLKWMVRTVKEFNAGASRPVKAKTRAVAVKPKTKKKTAEKKAVTKKSKTSVKPPPKKKISKGRKKRR